jgi:nitrous oxide reductase accessory protein NosL
MKKILISSILISILIAGCTKVDDSDFINTNIRTTITRRSNDTIMIIDTTHTDSLIKLIKY